MTDATDYLGEDPTSVASPQLSGRHHALTYDNLGNRLTASRTGTAGTPDTFTSNALNQYANRTNNYAHTAGTVANSSINVGVTGTNGAVASATGRQGRYWDAQVTLNNASGPATAGLAITGTWPNGGGANIDLFYTDSSRMAYLAAALQTFSYDDDGNLLTDGLWNYSYDAENRLVSMSTTTGSFSAAAAGFPNRLLEYKYDYLGWRVQKRVLDAGNSYAELSSRRYLYDGDNLVAEFNAPGGTSLGDLLKSYTWGLDLAGSLTATGGVGALVQLTDHATSTSYFPTFDGNGNVASLLRASDGAVVAKYEYSPFGELLRCEGAYAQTNPFRFSTKFTDDESGLVYYGARFYSPSLGRFVNRDPIAEAGGLNLYGFCGNDGVNGYDYLGYSWFSKLWKQVWKPIVAIAAGVLTGGLAYALAPAAWGSIATAAFAGGVGGFASGAVGASLNGASLGGALRAGLIGGAIGAALGGLGAINGESSTFSSIGDGTSSFQASFVFHLPAAAVPASGWRGFLDGLSSQGALGAAAGGGLAYGAGLVSGVWGAATGTVNAIAHPIATVQGISNGLGTFAGRALYDTGGLASAVGNGLYETVMDPSRLGYAVGNVVGGVGVGMGINGVATLAARSFVAEGSTARYLAQGFSAEQAEYLAQPYRGMGHHLLRREWGFPKLLTEGTVDSGSGLTRGQFYEYHYKVDPTFYGTGLPASAGGGAWRGAELGLSKFWWAGRSGYFGAGAAAAGASEERGLLYGW